MLKLPDTDVLFILDCCYAAQAFSRVEIGRRRFELFTATPPHMKARAPSMKETFTANLTKSLMKLLNENPQGFSTSQLYKEVYFQQELKRKPLLFDQSSKDYGKIWLRPFPRVEDDLTSNSATKKTEKQPKIFIDLRLEMESMPDQLTMNELARAMQYLPHVKLLRFEHLHAPEEELREFMRGIKQAMLLKPLLAKVRRRLAEKKAAQQGLEPPVKDEDCPSKSALYTQRRRSTLYDWSSSKEYIPHGNSATITTIQTVTDAQSHPHTAVESHEVERATERLEYSRFASIGRLFQISYNVDFSGFGEALKRLFTRLKRSWSRKRFWKIFVLATIISAISIYLKRCNSWHQLYKV